MFCGVLHVSASLNSLTVCPMWSILVIPSLLFSFSVAVCLCHEAATVAWMVRAAVAALPQVHRPNPILRTVASLVPGG